MLPAWAAVVVIAIVAKSQTGYYLAVGAAVVVLGTVVFNLFNWCCPACGRYLGRTFNPAFCARCGIALRDD
jgi:hypothetical protein